MKKVINNLKPYIINIVLVISIFLISLYLCKIYPFGNIVLGKSDAIVEFKPILYNFVKSIKEGIFDIYSFNNGLGNPVLFDFLYHLTSPLNAIAFLFDNPNSMYLSTIILKISIAAITTTFYCKKKIKNNLISAIVAISYVFSSWFIAYYYYLPWLDVFLVFPLFQYGLEKLLNDKKYNIYIFSLSFTLISNFYLAFSVCIYTIIYFIFFNIYKKNKIKEVINYFNTIFLSTLMSFLLSFVFLYALYNSYLKMAIAFSSYVSTEYTISIMDFIKSLFYGNISFVVNGGATFPNIATNTFILINLLYYFINKKIDKREKRFALIVLIICILPFFVKQLDFVLNFFHNVRGLTYRYSFIICFLSIIPFIRNIETWDEHNLRYYNLVSIPILILLIISYKNMEFNIFIFNLVSLISYNILIFFYDNNKVHKCLFMVLIIFQAIFACYQNISTDIDKSEELLPTTFKREKERYRLNKVRDNDYLNYNKYSNTDVTYLLTPMTYNKVFHLVESLGCDTASEASMTCLNSNKIFSMYFNVKNDYYLEKIFSVNKDILNIGLNSYNVKDSQEDLVLSTTGVKDIFDKHELIGIENGDKIDFKTNEDYYLIDYETDSGITNFVQQYREFYLNKDLEINKVNIYTVNEDKLKEAYEQLKMNQINYTYYSDSLIEGTINVSENQIIFTSIPYDTSWEITVDNEKVKPTMILDSLIGIEVKPGEHTIKLEYKNNFIIPLVISITTFIILIINIIIKRNLN